MNDEQWRLSLIIIGLTTIFLFIWSAILMFFLFDAYDLFEESITSGYVIFGCYLIFGVFGIIALIPVLDLIYLDSNLIQGNSRKLRKLKRKKYKMELNVKKLKVQKELEESKIEMDNECSKLKCQIKQLENQKNNKYQVCSTCGKQASLEACFCPQCGSLLN